MSKEVQIVELLWKDEQGRSARTALDWPLDAEVLEIEDALADLIVILPHLTGAGLIGAQVTIPLLIDGFAAVEHEGTNTAMDKSVWRWGDEDGNKMGFSIPAPLPGIMDTNDYQVNQTDEFVEDLIAWVIANLNSPYGKAIIAFIQAVRVWRNRKAKNS